VLRREQLLEKIHVRQGMATLMREYLGQTVGINSNAPNVVRAAKLLAVGVDHFSVFIEELDLIYSYPFRSLLTVIESLDPQGIHTLGTAAAYALVIQVVPAPSLVRPKKDQARGPDAR
jgi:hypothetical protein